MDSHSITHSDLSEWSLLSTTEDLESAVQALSRVDLSSLTVGSQPCATVLEAVALLLPNTPSREYPEDEASEAYQRVQCAKDSVDSITAECNASRQEILDKCIRALDCLSKGDLTELKSLKSPPTGVVTVVMAVMALLGKPSSWGEGQRVMADVNGFLSSLKHFDKDNILPKRVKAAQRHLRDLNQDQISCSSGAAKGLYLWVSAICTYHTLLQDYRQKEQTLCAARNELTAAQSALASARTIAMVSAPNFLERVKVVEGAALDDATLSQLTVLLESLEEQDVEAEGEAAAALYRWVRVVRRDAEPAESSEWEMGSMCSDATDWSEVSAVAVANLNSISKGDVTEVKSLASPPVAVKYTACAVCVAFGLPGTWKAATRAMADSRFLQRLSEFDPDQVSPQQLARLQRYAAQWTPDLVKKSSCAMAGLCLWVHALVAYRTATIHHWIPQQDEVVEEAPLPAKKENGLWSSLRELKVLKKPPSGSVVVLQAVMLLLGEGDVQEEIASTKLCSYGQAQAQLKHIPAFLQRLADFDRTAPGAQARVAAAEELLQAELGDDASGQRERLMCSKSASAAGLLKWVQGIIHGQAMVVTVPPHAPLKVQRVLRGAATEELLRAVRQASQPEQKAAALSRGLSEARERGGAEWWRRADVLGQGVRDEEEEAGLQQMKSVREAEESRWGRARDTNALPFRQGADLEALRAGLLGGRVITEAEEQA